MKASFAVLSTAVVFFLAQGLAFAGEPDGLTLPPGFHASVVTDGLGPIRHLAVRKNGDIYVSTLDNGIIALHLDTDHRADRVQHFGSVEGGTGIGFYDGALYATTASRVYRFTFSDNGALTPEKDPEMIVDGMPAIDPGFRRANRPLAFDGKGDLFVALSGAANICAEVNKRVGEPPIGLKPCPDLKMGAGVWRFHANKVGQKFPTDGERVATGIRDITSLDWSPADQSLYGIMQARDDTHNTWPGIVSAEDDDHIADQMDRIAGGTDFGWPYTYYDGVRKVRLVSPEYGGDGKTVAPAGIYSAPVLAFTPRSSPVDLVFYTGEKFPAAYRGGAFVALHGTRGKNGYDVVFTPFNRQGRAGASTVFVNGFAAFGPSGRAPSSVGAKYRPIGLAVGPDGALYIADSQKGRIWRITYEAAETARSSAE